MYTKHRYRDANTEPRQMECDGEFLCRIFANVVFAGSISVRFFKFPSELCCVSVTVPSKHNKHPERNFFSGQQKNSLQLVLTALCAVCLTGRKAGLAGCRLLRDSVQTFGPSPDGPRSEQLQKVCGPQPVRHPQEPVHQRHAGKGQLKHLCLCLTNSHQIG